MAKITKTRLTLAVTLCLGTTAMSAPPDLTNGGVPGDTISFNLGATGARGWAYHTRENTSESRQILVMSVAAGSPAAGILAANDVILGANGTGATAVNFSSDARKSLGLAIGAAEARNPATLSLIRWRAGVTDTVTLTLRTMGTYSSTAPYTCPKSAKILQEGLQYLMANETAGKYSFGTLSLLAANNNNPADPDNTARMARARTEARALIPSAATMTQMMSDARDATSMVTWQRGHTLIVLTEYYLATGDTQVLPAIEAYAVNIAKNSSLFGTMGHIFAEKNLDGSANGPMGGQYGPVNSTGITCFLGLLLARQCGLTNPEITPAIDRMSRFYAYYADRGSVPYGEHEPYWQAHESNGKSGLAALCFTLQNNRVEEGNFFAKMATAAASERGEGHTGAFFNYTWAPLGAACGGEEAVASHFSRIRWMLDLNRRWDGGFDYDCLSGEGPNSGSTYYDFRMSTAALLTYALPLRQLRITGKNHDSSRWFTSTDVAEAAAMDGYVASASLSISQLISDLGSWSPMVQRRAAEQLATRSIDTATLNQITALANDPIGNSRIGACMTLGKISNSTTANARAATLAALLTDPQNHVRFMAAEAMRYLPDSARLSQLNAILSAAASTATPLLPFDEEDPLHFAHARFGMLLFYSGSAYGPKGVIYGNKINTPTVINRNLLYPAISAVAANPVGMARSTLTDTYKNLTVADVDALADTLVDSIHFRAPSDKMFSGGVRQAGLFALEKYNIAEGVPLSKVYMLEDARTDAYAYALGVLKNYAGTCTTVTPDPDIIGFCQSLLGGGNAAAAQAVLDAIATDINPVTAIPFKSIQSATVDASSFNLPANQTTLHASASDLAKGSSVYTWRKLHGAGHVTFTPNGTAAAINSVIQFGNVPGKYLFEVKMSDSRGFTEVYKTVAVTLRNPDGTLPPNSPPAAIPQTINAAPASVKPVTLSGTDPEAYPLVYSVTSQPAHGALTGTPPNLFYTPDVTYLGADSFTFQVMDTEGQLGSATVSIDVSAAGVQLLAYEGFDYAPVNDPLLGRVAGRNGGTGWAAAWQDSTSGSNGGEAFVYDSQGNPDSLYGGTYGVGLPNWNGVVTNLPTTGGYAGLSDWSNQGVGNDRLNSHRLLAENAGAMAASNNGVLWLSAVWHFQDGNYYAPVGLALTSGGSFEERAKTISNSPAGTGNAMGVGNGAVLDGSLLDLNPTFWANGAESAQTMGTNISTSADNIIILKFEFGATDTVRAWYFTENQEMTEATFNNNAVSSTSSINENTLTTLAVSTIRFGNAIDEIRIGNSFAAVIGVDGAPPDTTPPTLAATAIVDDRGGEPVQQNTPVIYTVPFSEEMNPTTVNAADFGNAGTSAVTIGSITQNLPGVFTVQVMPATVGSLQLRVNAGAVLTDTAGNPLNTTAVIEDDTVITVNPAISIVPEVIGLTQSAAEAAITAVSLTVGTVTALPNESVPAGNVISQNPAGGAGVAKNTAVNVVVSLGPHATGYEIWTGDPGGSFLRTLTDPSVDADFDDGGLPTGIEWVVGGDPTDGRDDAGRTPTFHNNDPDNFIFTFRRRDAAHADPYTTITVQYATALSGWNTAIHGGNSVNMDDAAVPEDGFHTVVVSIPKTLAGPGGRLFARLRVANTP